jgi:hypothetical protein
MTPRNHTPGPWVVFSDRGKTIAIMPAGRPGDVCAFSTPPTKADAQLMIAAPDLLETLQGVVRVADRKTVEFDAARAAIKKALKP